MAIKRILTVSVEIIVSFLNLLALLLWPLGWLGTQMAEPSTEATELMARWSFLLGDVTIAGFLAMGFRDRAVTRKILGPVLIGAYALAGVLLATMTVQTNLGGWIPPALVWIAGLGVGIVVFRVPLDFP
jgi:peptidoglycan/LPS O-acetylase OafA/YrhL